MEKRKSAPTLTAPAVFTFCWPLANVGAALWLNYIFNLSAGGELQAIKWQIKFSFGFYFICQAADAAGVLAIFAFFHSPAANVFLICVSLSDDLGALTWQIFGSASWRWWAGGICWIFHECHKFLLYTRFSFAALLFLITFHCGCQWQAGNSNSNTRASPARQDWGLRTRRVWGHVSDSLLLLSLLQAVL